MQDCKLIQSTRLLITISLTQSQKKLILINFRYQQKLIL